VSDGGPRLALLARLAEAVRWDDAVRRHETDPWAYVRRKLQDTEGPLRAYKLELFAAAKARLLDDLARPMMPPGAIAAHKEAFEALIPAGDYADLSFHLDPGADRQSRLDGARFVLDGARAPTLFDHEAATPDRRSRAWDKRVAEMTQRLAFDSLARIVERAPPTPAGRARIARRLRRNLGEYLAVTGGGGPLRDEITPFMLARIEAAVAAALRLLGLLR
jgi:hypothetical protein